MSTRPVFAAPPMPSLPLRQVAVPVEHGGWGLLGEPIAFALIVAPSWAGVALGLFALFAFLARHPLRLALSDWRRGTRHPRTAMAERVAAVYAGAAVLCLALAAPAMPASAWAALAAAAPLALAQLVFDARLQGRQLLPELAGGVALGSIAAAMVLAGGWPLAVAVAAWALLALKAVTSVLYVRARLRLERGVEGGVVEAVAAHFAALAAAVALAAAGLAPWLAPLALALLLARASHGLSPFRRACRARAVGFQELAYGIVTTAMLAAGYALQL